MVNTSEKYIKQDLKLGLFLHCCHFQKFIKSVLHEILKLVK
jgi:hypothetical protein